MDQYSILVRFNRLRTKLLAPPIFSSSLETKKIEDLKRTAIIYFFLLRSKNCLIKPKGVCNYASLSFLARKLIPCIERKAF